jgi:uncharacterized protein
LLNPHSSILGAASGRVLLLDALRAVALFGILQVNIQSFLFGGGDPLGYFLAPPRLIDTVVYLAIGTFVSLKFLSLFALLFGYGFTLQMRKLTRRHGLAGAKGHYRRRLTFLLVVGLAHGLLLYYGDILTGYAIAGFVLVAFAGSRSRQLLALARNAFIVYLLLSVPQVWLLVLARRAAPFEGDPSAVPQNVIEQFAVMVTGGYLEQLPLRVEDFLVQLWGLLFAVPLFVALFALGALAARQRWLERPQRFGRLWRRAVPLGLAGLVLSALGAWFNYGTMLDAPGDPDLIGYTLMGVAFPALALYLAWVVRRQGEPWMQAAIAWLAPAGRMPLTNYLMQSVLMGALLTGWGLALGLTLYRAELALLALAIVAVQIVLSRWWIARFGQGPVEWLWSRVTYGDR